MNFGACVLSMIPCRREASDTSEIVNQLLFGEHFEIIQSEGAWSKIRNSYDGYEGWIDNKQFIKIREDEYSHAINDATSYVGQLTGSVTSKDQKTINVVLGSSLPSYSSKKITIGKKVFDYDGEIFKIGNELASSIINLAKRYLTAPYLWGGKSPFGIDCSGFVQQVYRLHHIHLPRDASQQIEFGEDITLDNSKSGDLAFFHNESGKITHVGIVMGEGKIIHASGQVRIDKLDQKGIKKGESNEYSHQLNSLKRII